MAQPKLKEVLTGPQGVKYGALPKIALPGDDETLLRFAQDLLDEMKEKPIYRRDNVAVYPYTDKGRLEMMTAQTFRTFIDRYVACFKQKFDDKGEPFDVVRSVNKETAAGVLESIDFWSGLREIIAINPVPMPTMDETGKLKLLEPGYDEQTKTLTFG
jgi:hypothetical protein